MIITVGGIKGGSGKSTLATNLAVLHARRGRTLLVDADEQGSSYDFTQARAERLGAAGFTCTKQHGRGVLAAVRDFAQVHETVVIDVGGRDTASQRAALLASDVAVFPFVPRPYDVWTFDALAALVDEVRGVNAGLLACSYLNRADHAGVLIRETQALLQDGTARGILFAGLGFGNRIAFANAAGQGLAVDELRPLDLKAASEVCSLHDYILALYQQGHPTESEETPHGISTSSEASQPGQAARG